MTADGAKANPLLSVTDLAVHFETEEGRVRAVDGMSLTIGRGEMVGLVGESGCGKTAACLAILGLLPQPAGRVAKGTVAFDGQDLARLSSAERRSIRGRRIAMIFQDPMMSLNPYLRIEQQLTEGPRLHLGESARAARRRALEMLQSVGLPEPERRLRQYPHELSGGMRQRVMIAMALVCEPDLLIADEPTTALDVTIQAQILDLLEEQRAQRGTSVLFITHDLAVVSGLCDRVIVMYAGRVVEEAPAHALFSRPLHPYTAALLRSIPRVEAPSREPLASIEGMPPRLDRGGFDACAFEPRCPLARDVCREAEPELQLVDGRRRRCVVPAREMPRT